MMESFDKKRDVKKSPNSKADSKFSDSKNIQKTKSQPQADGRKLPSQKSSDQKYRKKQESSEDDNDDDNSEEEEEIEYQNKSRHLNDSQIRSKNSPESKANLTPKSARSKGLKEISFSKQQQQEPQIYVQPKFNPVAFDKRSQEMSREDLMKYYALEMSRIESTLLEDENQNEMNGSKILPGDEEEIVSTYEISFKSNSGKNSKSQKSTQRKDSKKSSQSMIKVSDKKQDGSVDFTINSKLLEDPNKLQTWLNTRNPEKDLDVSFIPKEYLYKHRTMQDSYANMKEKIRDLDHLARPSVRIDLPRKKKQDTQEDTGGFFGKLIGLLNCSNKRDK